MDIKFSTFLVQEIDDALFDRLFAASFPHIDQDPDGLNPTFFNHAQGYPAKRNHMIMAYRRWIFEPGGFVFAIAANDEPVMLHAGQVINGVAVSYLTLLGPYMDSVSWVMNPGVYASVEQWFTQDNPLNTHQLCVHSSGQGSGYEFILAQFDRMFTKKGQHQARMTTKRHYLDRQQTMQTFDYTYQEITWDFSPEDQSCP
jgi:hypothetical protein